MDRIKNKPIRVTTRVRHLGDKVETRLIWFGHIKRRDNEYIGRWMLEMELQGK